MTTEEMVEVMNAYTAGKGIEFKRHEDNEWVSIDHPTWCWHYYDYRVEPESKRMTNRQLAEWCAKGNGQWKYNFSGSVATGYILDSEEHDDVEVHEKIVIRSWDSDIWVEPTEKIYLRDCKGRLSYDNERNI